MATRSRMAIKTGSFNSVNQCPRVVTPGWAAFDRLQRQRQGIEPQVDSDPYPPITNMKERKDAKATFQQKKSFSSILKNENTLKSDDFNNGKRAADHYYDAGMNFSAHVEKLKRYHIWANEGLIQDILATVDNDVQQASSVLKAMSSNNNGHSMNPITDTEGPLDKIKYPDECKMLANEESVYCSDESDLTAKPPFVIPVEPEWEEDDIYLTHRRDAIKMMRAASKHSKAASKAFLRGDHSSARQHSIEAKGERAAAEVLNSNAARAILRTRNNIDDIWKLDLHGLHASEVVSILKDRLNLIETTQTKASSTRSHGTSKSLYEHLGAPAMEPPIHIIQASSRSRQMLLHVITGIGKHSQEEAVLPSTVRGFLVENGYWFDDAKPGVFAIRPKFCFRCMNPEVTEQAVERRKITTDAVIY